MNSEKMREGFESANSDRAWFVHGGKVDDGPEGFVYDDFTTDICWTCWVDSRASITIKWPDHYDYTNSDIAGAAILDCRTAFQNATRVKP